MKLTEGEVTALAGDLFGSPEAMASASSVELTRLRDLVRRDKAAREGRPGFKPVKNDEWDRASGGRYMKLAEKNEAHFAAPGKGGTEGPRVSKVGGHKTEWIKYHFKAVHIAVKERSVTGEAILANSFASHYLTDAFAAGHLVAKEDIMEEAKKQWDSGKGILFKESSFTKGVAQGVLASPEAKKAFVGKQLKLVEWGEITVQRFSELLMKMAERKPDKFFNGFAKVVHDKLNEAIEGGKGVGIQVANAKGDQWELSGDGTLNLSAETEKIAQQAVEAANHNIEKAAKSDGDLDYETMVKSVWDHTPRPTARGGDQIKKTIETFTNSKDPKAVDAFVELAIRELPIVMAELEKEGHLRDAPKPPKPQDWPKGMP